MGMMLVTSGFVLEPASLPDIFYLFARVVGKVVADNVDSLQRSVVRGLSYLT